jgi:hypothetical protein
MYIYIYIYIIMYNIYIYIYIYIYTYIYTYIYIYEDLGLLAQVFKFSELRFRSSFFFEFRCVMYT